MWKKEDLGEGGEEGTKEAGDSHYLSHTLVTLGGSGVPNSPPPPSLPLLTRCLSRHRRATRRHWEGEEKEEGGSRRRRRVVYGVALEWAGRGNEGKREGVLSYFWGGGEEGNGHMS